MPNTVSPDTDPDTNADAPVLRCDLCVVGAGIAGLNALIVATEYLPRGARVVLIDRNDGCGGMWTRTYDHVRLHQPHGMFTVGDLPWGWDRPAGYLATGAEVLAHLRASLDVVRARVELVELWGHRFEDCAEVEAGGARRVRALCHPCAQPTATRRIEATRLIDAVGLGVPAARPLALSSDRVASVTPEIIGATPPDAPVVVVGGGKTGMDTVLALAERAPGRRITLVNGRGTVFADRDACLPAGLRRWWAGEPVLTTFRKLARRFDGTNEAAVSAWFRDRYAISPAGGEQFFFGLLSRDERDRIALALDAVVDDYLVDVADGAQGPEMILRSGARRPVPPGTVVVNCTGHLLRDRRAYRPYLSPGGAILAVTTRSAVHFQSSVAAWFLAHLFFRGRLADAPLYELDLGALFGQGRALWHMTCVAHALLNTLVMMERLPIEVLDRCGLDMDRWFPLPRRLAALLVARLTARRSQAHCRKVLDAVQRRLGIRCGPLPGATGPRRS